MAYQFGRKPRGHDSRIPKMSMLRAGKALAPLPASVDYSAGMPANLGALLNDTLGDCVEAAVGHAIQTWTFNADGAANMVTPSNADIEAFYGVAGGYIPGNPNTDNGTIIQVALTDWLNTPVDNNELAAFVEVDQLDLPNVKRAIWECGLCYIGFNVPSFLQNLEEPGSLWDVNPNADNTIIDGHAVILVGYRDANGNMPVQSWGYWYTMTPAFFSKFVDEAYGLGNAAWIRATGLSPAGLTLAELEALMVSLKNPQPANNRRRHRHHRRMKRRGAVVG